MRGGGGGGQGTKEGPEGGIQETEKWILLNEVVERQHA